METEIKSAWSSPSNIALVKYWGKLPAQIPANSSVSFTLKHSVTKMTVEILDHFSDHPSLDFYFEGIKNEKFKEKIFKFLEIQKDKFPWILKKHLSIHSENTFPHSSGIASSASSMSALALCLLELDEKISGKKYPEDVFLKEASELARLASGSAGRSVYPFMATWGDIADRALSSRFHADALLKEDVHPIFHSYRDSIIIVDENEKSVSSRAGHSLMENHPFKNERFKRAEFNMQRLLLALKEGNLETFIEVVEEEALMLHALMMTSSPCYILLKPHSLLVIEKIREFRKLKNIPVCFTIDAGPNIHLLYPDKHKDDVQRWISDELPGMRVIHDEVGDGPQRIKD